MRMDKAQFKKLKKTEQFPEPKMNLCVKQSLIQLFEKRLAMYKTSIKVRLLDIIQYKIKKK